MITIGFSAKAGHGKDFCAKIFRELARNAGALTTSVAFADPLKTRVYGEFNGRYSFEDVWVRKPPEVRNRLQLAGTEEGRDVFGEDFWTLQIEASLRLKREREPYIRFATITDVRFPNEVTTVQQNGVTSPTRNREIQELIAADDRHAPWQEAELLDWYTAVWEKRNKRGISLRIVSDRPTLTGAAAQHRSETALDGFSDRYFDGVIVNNLDTSIGELQDQLLPWVRFAEGL